MTRFNLELWIKKEIKQHFGFLAVSKSKIVKQLYTDINQCLGFDTVL